MRRARRWLILILVVVASLWWLLPTGGSSVPQGSVLVVELQGEYVESDVPPLLSRLLGERARPFASLLGELAKAERDDRLAGVVLRVRDLEIGWAKAQELRDAIESLAEAGRLTAALLEIEGFGANLEYYVASAAQKVYVAPASRVPVVGLAAEYLFLGGLWERFGLEVEVERIGRYKSAAESLAGRSMSDATREMADSLLDSVDAQFVEGIGRSRELPPASVREAIAAAPSESEALRRFGLVDGEKSLDQAIEELGGPGAEALRSRDYASVSPEQVGFDPVARFALVYGSGGVVTGEGRTAPDGSPVLASDTVAEAIEQAAEDEEIDAIIFRIDSPGGSALASDIVWRATERAKQHGKPVIASFSDVAASGGYYVAAGSDAIVASPASLTGSIGVFVLRPVIGGTLEKIDVGFETLTRGRHADLLLATRPLSPASREKLRQEVRSIYDLFVGRVAAGRGRSAEQIDAVAQGRVWTGAQALDAGLVDRLGGLRAAIAEGRERLSLDEDADVALVVYPPPRSLLEQIGDVLGGVRASLLPAPFDALSVRLQPWLRALSDGAPAALPPVALEIR